MNIERLEYKDTTNYPTLLAPRHFGNSSFYMHSRGYSSLRFSRAVGGGFGNLPLNINLSRSTALIRA